MTEKLFYDCTRTSCDAAVLDCRECEDNTFEVLLDRTVIFPEGGGQLSDEGYIGDARVSYAFERDGGIWHRCDRALEIGATYQVRFDEALRRDHSAQHTGEHMLSGLASSLYGCVNVGFHMAADYVSVDFDKQLSEEEVERLETAVNEAIQLNKPTQYRIVNEDELKDIKLRKSAKGLEGEIRIVYCGGVDSCTCCGTHCQSAGEVGVLKVLSHANYKGGTRIFFVCAMRAVKSMRQDSGTLEAISRRFSTKREQALQNVIKQGDELVLIRREMKRRTDLLFNYMAAEMFAAAQKAGGTAVAVKRLDGYSAQELGFICERFCAMGDSVIIALCSNAEQLIYRMARGGNAKLSMKELCAAVNAITGGKGGGRDDSAQGSAPKRAYTDSGMDDMCTQLERYITSRLKG